MYAPCDHVRYIPTPNTPPQLDVYHERLVRGDGAALVRIRWDTCACAQVCVS